MRKLTSALLSFAFLFPATVLAKANLAEYAQRSAENQIRHLLEPVLEKYCHDECKLLSVSAQVDVAVPDEVAPGFDDVDPGSTDLSPSSGKARVLINDKVGPVSRTKLLELIQQYLDTLDYPIKVDFQLAHFPEPIESAGRVIELRDKITKQFKANLEELFSQFCPGQCLLADFTLETEVVNGEEAQYGQGGEFVHDGSVAMKIKDLSATILLDQSLTPEEQANLLEMAKLKTNYLKNVNLTSKSMKFPHPMAANGLLSGPGLNGKGVFGPESKVASETTTTDKANRTENNLNQSTSTQESKTKSSTATDNKSTSTSSNNSNNNSKSENVNNESNTKQEHFERFEKLERVENGDAVQAELQKFKIFGLIFACSILALLVFVAMASYRPRNGASSSVQRVFSQMVSDPMGGQAPNPGKGGEGISPEASNADSMSRVAKRFEIERLVEELSTSFGQFPKVAKHVFTRILTEEGVETTAHYIHIFGEGIVIEMLRDPSLQGDMSELLEYYAKNTIEMDEDEKLDLLRKLHNRTIASKLFVMGNRSTNLFEFLAEMDANQILEMVRPESLTVKAIVLTQCDPQKRANIYSKIDEEARMKLLTELSRIDHLPRDYIFNVANALKRKRRENPRLNTEALPGSEVLISLLERTSPLMQRAVMDNLDSNNPESARTVKGKLVSIDTLRYLRDSQLLEVILSLRHDELLAFLKGAPSEIRSAIFAKSPKELIVELEEELANLAVINRETYNALERKVLNRMKLMANDGLINLIETNERMFADSSGGTIPNENTGTSPRTETNVKKVIGW